MSDQEKTADELFHMQSFETPEARLAASRLSVAKRQWMIEHMLVEYHTFNVGTKQISTLHKPFDGGTASGGKVGALLGESRTGKSWICEAYAARHPPRVETDQEVFPVLYLPADVRWTPFDFAQEVNTRTDNPFATRRGGEKEYIRRAISRLYDLKVELLIVDDAQYLFFERRADTVMDMFKILKRILDMKQTSILLSGEERVDDFVSSIDAFRRRGYNREPLRQLTGSDRDLVKFGALLKSIDRRLPFAESSGLDATAIRNDIHKFSNGLIGVVMDLIWAASARAINRGGLRIMLEDLRAASLPRAGLGDPYKYFRSA